MEIIDTSVEFLALNSKYTCITIEHSFENVLKRFITDLRIKFILAEM